MSQFLFLLCFLRKIKTGISFINLINVYIFINILNVTHLLETKKKKNFEGFLKQNKFMLGHHLLLNSNFSVGVRKNEGYYSFDGEFLFDSLEKFVICKFHKLV